MNRIRKNSRKGTTALEFAIVAIPMITVTFGCLEMSRLFMIESMAENAAFESLRHVMVDGAKKSEGIAKANQMLGYFGTQNSSVVITAFDDDGKTQSDIDDHTSTIRVAIQVPMANNSFLLSAFTKNVVIRKVAEMNTERHKGYYDGTTSSGS